MTLRMWTIGEKEEMLILLFSGMGDYKEVISLNETEKIAEGTGLWGGKNKDKDDNEFIVFAHTFKT